MSTISPSSTLAAAVAPAAPAAAGRRSYRSVFVHKRLNETAMAVLDSCDYYYLGLMITRINVPASHRGAGHGTWLLTQLLDKADTEGIKLFLEPAASGGLSQDELVAWYMSHGFTWWKGIMRRMPCKKEQQA